MSTEKWLLISLIANIVLLIVLFFSFRAGLYLLARNKFLEELWDKNRIAARSAIEGKGPDKEDKSQ